MSAFRSRLVRLALATFVLAAFGFTGAASVGAEDFQPPSPNVDRPLYQPTRAGLDHFMQDNLQKLVACQSWTWMGHEFQAVRLHRVQRSDVNRDRQANRDFASPHRGWAVVHLHVKVDGQVKAARTEVNCSYVWQPGGWAFEQVLLYLGNGDAYDFVSGKIR
jgi:hypothetical protein